MQNVGQTFTLRFKGKTLSLTNLSELPQEIINSATALKQVISGLERADAPLEAGTPELVLRVTWSKATRKFPSKPFGKLVTIADWNFSPAFVITETGEQVSRSTLYRMPQAVRVADIFSKRNER